MLRRSFVALVVVAAMLVSGCTGSSRSGPKDADVVVTSTLPDVTEIGSGGAERPAPEPPKVGTRGHLAGFVVSDTLRPIVGASVKLPGMDLTQKSDRDGSFGFVDLRPGPYFLTVNASGYYGAQAEVVVKADEFVRVKVVLTPIPPPTPYHRTETFRGFADLSSGPIFNTGFVCNGCTASVYPERVPETLVLEAYTESPDVGFRLYLQGASSNAYIASGDYPNPMRIEIPREKLEHAGGEYRLRVYPESLVPQMNVRFDVYATMFYNEPAPAGWSLLNGGA